MLSNEDYLKADGGTCPNCKSEDLESIGQMDTHSTEGYLCVKCNSCGSRWTDVWKLSGYTDYNEDFA